MRVCTNNGACGRAHYAVDILFVVVGFLSQKKILAHCPCYAHFCLVGNEQSRVDLWKILHKINVLNCANFTDLQAHTVPQVCPTPGGKYRLLCLMFTC